MLFYPPVGRFQTGLGAHAPCAPLDLSMQHTYIQHGIKTNKSHYNDFSNILPENFLFSRILAENLDVRKFRLIRISAEKLHQPAKFFKNYG